MTPIELKAARLRLGLTQKGLAQALSDLRGELISVRTVQGWESGWKNSPIPWCLIFALEKLESIANSKPDRELTI